MSGIVATLQPVAHALTQADEDVQGVLPELPEDLLWARPGGAASIGFHAKHSLGSLDRLFTYARGETLDERQLGLLAAEKSLDRSAGGARQLADDFAGGVKRALEQLRQTPESELLEPREVGRARLPSTVLGLLFHAAEHTAGHVAQIITTAKILTGSRSD